MKNEEHSQDSMTNATPAARAAALRETPPGGISIGSRGPSVQKALAIAILGAIAAAILTFFVLRNDYRVGIEALLAALALLAFGISAYGMLQTVLAVVDSAGERRRQDREVTERRQGDRARQPRP